MKIIMLILTFIGLSHAGGKTLHYYQDSSDLDGCMLLHTKSGDDFDSFDLSSKKRGVFRKRDSSIAKLNFRGETPKISLVNKRWESLCGNGQDPELISNTEGEIEVSCNDSTNTSMKITFLAARSGILEVSFKSDEYRDIKCRGLDLVLSETLSR